MRTIRRLRFALVIPTLALLLLAGCFDTASELSCTQSKYCPDGYVCVGAQTGAPGKCQKPADAGGFDVPIVVDSAEGIDGRANTDGPVPPNDGPTTNTDMPAAIDQAPSLDTLNEPDTASDLPASADLDRDVPSDSPISPADMSVDNTVPVPDLGPEQKPEGPEVWPDAPSTICVIGGTSYASGAANPANACQTCQTAYALTSWTASANGASCGTGQVCSGGTCQSGCWIEGALVGSGNTNSSNVCQICKPATSTSGWSNNIDGTSCGSGRICSAGTCQCTTGTDCGTSGCIDVNGSDSSHCGSCTNVCASNQACSLGNCACTIGASACGGCLGWNFESGTQGWAKDTDPNAPVNGGDSNTGISVSIDTSHTYGSGVRSLKMNISVDGTTVTVASAAVPLCQSGASIDLTNRTIYADVFLSGTQAFNSLGGLQAVAWDTSSASGGYCILMWGDPMTTAQTNGTWSHVSCSLSGTADHVSIRFYPNGSAWTGQIYVDNVEIK